MTKKKSAAVLMATYNGAEFLEEQIASIFKQIGVDVHLVISDDGSTDDTLAIASKMRSEAQAISFLKGPATGFSDNFRHLILNAEVDADYFAFSDQDDIWDDDKLLAARNWLDAQPADTAALYCTRTRTMSSSGKTSGLSPLFARAPSFNNALVQSLAGGNTMVLNRSAFLLLRESSRRTAYATHDWWTYIIISGGGGRIHYCPDPRISYRQHNNNIVGSNTGLMAKMQRVKLMLTGRFERWNLQNLAALDSCSDLLSDQAQLTIEKFKRARSASSAWKRLAHLRNSGVYRQTPLGDLGLLTSCLLKKM